MKSCQHCGFSNREGFMFCEDCGRPLGHPGEHTLPTKQLDIDSAMFNARSTWGTARFDEMAQIVLHIRDAPEPVTLTPEARVIIGRADARSPQRPDFDLTPYGALEKGVSRIHASIVRTDETLTIVDMGSSNGTHLNGQRLIPEQPRIVRDGDEIRFGKLVTHIYFKS
jgi:hypothetical protein